MIFLNSYWAHDLSLKNCLSDPRFDKELRKAVANFIVKQEASQLSEKGDGIDSKDRVLVVHRDEVSSGKNDFFALGASPEQRQAIRNETRLKIKNFTNAVKSVVSSAIEKNQEFNAVDLPMELQFVASSYYKKICEVWEYRANLLIESYTNVQREDNSFLAAEEKLRENKKSFKLVSLDQAIEFDSKTQSVGSVEHAQITTSCGRPRESKPNHQEDRAGILSSVALHPSWTQDEDRIPELIALTAQKLAIDIYENVPIFDLTDFSSGPMSNDENNCTLAGSTLVSLFIWNKKAYAFNLGDSSIVYLKKDKATNKTDSQLMTWSHNPGKTAITNNFESSRVTKEEGDITSNNRVRNIYQAHLALSRAFGDREAKGLIDIGNITVFDIPDVTKSQSAFVLGSDGAFDFITKKRWEYLCKFIKVDSLADAFCKEAARVEGNKDNITAVSVPGDVNGVVAFVGDGHGKSCISEWINKKHLPLFKSFAENVAPQKQHMMQAIQEIATNDVEPKQKKIKVDPNELSRSFTSLSPQAFFSSNNSEIKTPVFEPVYSKNNLLNYISHLENFYDETRSVEALNADLLENKIPKLCFIKKSDELSEGLYKIHYLFAKQFLEVSFYLPTEFPMSYDEFIKIPVDEYQIMTSEFQLKQYLLDTEAKIKAYASFQVEKYSPHTSR